MTKSTTKKTQKVISYLRFSTDRQFDGDSYRRQTQLTEDWCRKNGYELLEKFEDTGVSGFHGLNTKEGGDFHRLLNLLKLGKIETGTILVVENLDRISRQKPLSSISIIEEVLSHGIEIQTLFPEVRYTKEYTQLEVLQMVFSLIGSNSESLKKSNRLKEVWKNKRDQIQNNQPVKLSRIPSWLEQNPKTLKIQKVKWKCETVKKIFQLFSKGQGYQTILIYLNSNNIKPISGKKWGLSYIKKIITSPSVIGYTHLYNLVIDEKTGKKTRVKTTDEPVKLYPPIVTKRLFEKCQSRLSKTTTPGRVGFVNLFPTSIIKCGRCGGKLNIFKNDSGPRSRRFLCVRNKWEKNCPNGVGYPYHELEVTFLKHVSEFEVGDIFDSENHEQSIKSTRFTLEQKSNSLIKLNKEINRLQKLIVSTDLDNERDIWRTEWSKKLNQKNKLESEIKDLENELTEVSKDFEKSKSFLRLVDLKGEKLTTDIRQRLKNLIVNEVESIQVFSYRNQEDIPSFKGKDEDWLKYLKKHRLTVNQPYQKKLRCYWVKFRYHKDWRLIRGIEKYYKKGGTVTVEKPSVIKKLLKNQIK